MPESPVIVFCKTSRPDCCAQGFKGALSIPLLHVLKHILRKQKKCPKGTSTRSLRAFSPCTAPALLAALRTNFDFAVLRSGLRIRAPFIACQYMENDFLNEIISKKQVWPRCIAILNW
jgi:hypothetical protein